MRKSIISSLVATVVAKANDCLVAAGLVAGARLRRISMREHLGNWHEPMFALHEQRFQPACTRGDTQGCLKQDYLPQGYPSDSSRLPNVFDNILNVVSQLRQRSSKRSLQHVYAFSPAYAAIARTAPKG